MGASPLLVGLASIVWMTSIPSTTCAGPDRNMHQMQLMASGAPAGAVHFLGDQFELLNMMIWQIKPYLAEHAVAAIKMRRRHLHRGAARARRAKYKVSASVSTCESSLYS
jgi:hypothetical protein